MSSQNSELRFQNLKTRYETLEDKYIILEKLSESPRTVFEAKEIIVEKPVYTRIGHEVDMIMNMQRANNKKMHQELVLNMLFLNSGYTKYYRMAHKCKQEIIEIRRC